MKNNRILFTIVISIYCQSLYSLQSARSASRAIRPVIVNRAALAHMPKTTYQREQDQSSRSSSAFDYRTMPFYTAVGATLGAAYYDARKDIEAYKKERESFEQPKNRLQKMSSHLNDPASLASQHLTKFEEKYPDVFKTILNSKSIDQFIGALDKAIDLNNQGYISFFHGQQPGYALSNDIGTVLLYKLAGQKKPDDFDFLRFRSKDFAKTDSTYWPIWLNTIQNIFGAVDEVDEVKTDPRQTGFGQDFMSLNFFPFGNSQWETNSTYYYVENKFNEGTLVNRVNHYSILNNTLAQLGIPYSAIQAMTARAIQLFKMADETFKTGRLILIAFPYNVVSKRVYAFVYPGYVKRYGARYSHPLVEKRSRNILDSIEALFGNERTFRNIDEIIEALGTEGSKHTFEQLDTFHCIMPLTPAGALNPESGIKIFNFDNPVSKKALQEFERAKQEFIDELIRHLKESGNFEKSQKIARNYLKFLHDVHIAEEQRLTGV